MKRHHLCAPALVLLLCLLTGFLAGCDAWQAGPPDTARELLAITSSSETINLVDLQGRETDIAGRIGAGRAGDAPAVWSPSGKYVAYKCWLSEGYLRTLCSVDVAQMVLHVTPLPEISELYSFTWSLDEGAFLALWRGKSGGPQELWRVDVESGQHSLLSQLVLDAEEVSWSPDRSQLAFVASRPGSDSQRKTWWEGQDLYIANVDGTGARLTAKDVGRGISWSPGGQTIAFGRGTVCWIAISGGEATCVSERSYGAAWSPTGESLAFVSDKDVSIVDMLTQEVRHVFHHSGNGSLDHLSWSPDGQYLVYDACCCLRPNGSCEVYVARADGTRSWQLTKNNIADEFPVWQPMPGKGQNR